MGEHDSQTRKKDSSGVSRRDFVKYGILLAGVIGVQAIPGLAYAAKKLAGGQVVTVLDDLGASSNNVRNVRLIEEMNSPWVGSILPGQTCTDKVCREVKDYRNADLFMHQPMQPENPKDLKYMERNVRKKGEKYNPKKHFGIYDFDGPRQAYNIIINNVLQLEHILGGEKLRGINPHTGSLASRNTEVMRGVAAAMHRINRERETPLVYLDSVTYRPNETIETQLRSIFEDEARVQYLKRNIWFDSFPKTVKTLKDKKDHVLHQLSEAYNMCKAGETIIGIGHIHKNSMVAGYRAASGYPFAGVDALMRSKNL